MQPAPKVFIFDAFGTLFNLQIPLDQLNEMTAGQGTILLELWRRKQLEYTWLRGLMQAYVPFDRVTEEALTFAMHTLGLSDPAVYQLLMPIYQEPQVFADVPAVLMALKKRQLPAAILSNGTPQMLEAGARKAGITDHLVHLLSVDSVRTYKPDPEVYQIVLEVFECAPEEVCFVSSNTWDVAGAGHFGFQTVWVNRNGGTPEALPPPATLVISDLSELTEKVLGGEDRLE